MKNIDTLINLVRPYAVRVDANKMNNSEKQTTMELLSGPKKTVKMPPYMAKLIKQPAIKTVTLIMRRPKNNN